MHTTPSRLFHHTALTRAHLICCVGGATTPPHNHTHFTPSLPFLRPYSAYNHTGVVCLINCHGLTFDLLPRPLRHPAGIRGHTERGTRPPIITSWLRAPQVKHGPAMPRPTGSNKTCIKAHTHTVHTELGTRQQAKLGIIGPALFFFLGQWLIVNKECFDLALMWAITGLFFMGHFRSLITLA